MRNLMILFLILMITEKGNAQTNSSADQGQRLAMKMAQKMKDSLNLTGQQMNQLYQINLSLHNQKKQLMISSLGRDSIGRGLQRIEGKRDSLYRLVLPASKMDIYKVKKRFLINNNN